jgi:hypothetical protein
MRQIRLIVFLCAFADLAMAQPDPTVRVLQNMNAQLAAMGSNVRVEGVDFFTIGKGRSSIRLHQIGVRLVPGDIRRIPVILGAGNGVAYAFDLSDGTAGSVTPAQTEAATDSAMNTWDNVACARNLDIVKFPDPGFDFDLVDFLLGFGPQPFILGWADIIHAGWMPKGFFDAAAPPNGGDITLGATFLFILADGSGQPTDINNDGYADAAFSETYYNNNPAFAWGINVALPGVDVQSVVLHESGHGLDLGHFGSPPAAVMNPQYSGLLQSLLPTDQAAHCALFASWPNR